MDYKPNKWAIDNVHASPYRFNTLVTARQVGKTIAASMQIHQELEELPSKLSTSGEVRPPNVGVLSFDYAHAAKSVEEYMARALRIWGKDYLSINQNDHRIKVKHSGAELRWLSADDERSLAGHTFSAIIIDEGQFVPDNAMAILRPTLSVREARVYSFGTPQLTSQQSWFRADYLRGQDPEYPEYHSYTVSCYENPWMPLTDIQLAQSTETERNFRMLYLGEWVDEEGSVFHDVDKAIVPEIPFNKDNRHVMSVDFAITEDFNVVMVGEASTKTVIHMERWRRQGSISTYDRVQAIWERMGKPKIYVDSQGIGRPMMEELQQRGLPVYGIQIKSNNKIPMIQRLASDIEHRRIMFPNFEQLVRELKAYQYETTPSGQLTANAPAGYHDDTVTALMLLNEGMRTSGSGSRQYSYMGAAELPRRMRRLVRA